MLKKWWSTSKLTENKNTFRSPLIFCFFLSTVLLSEKTLASSPKTQIINGEIYYLGTLERDNDRFTVKNDGKKLAQTKREWLHLGNLEWLERIHSGETYRVYFSGFPKNPKAIKDVKLIGTIREVHSKDKKLIFGVITHPLYNQGLWFFGKDLILPRLMRRFPELYLSGIFPGREVLFHPIHKKEGPFYFFAEEILATHYTSSPCSLTYEMTSRFSVLKMLDSPP